MSTFEVQQNEGVTGFDPISAMSTLDTTRRRNIIGTIVGHPSGTPSRKELEYYNPSIKPTTLSSNLRALEEAGIIESATKDREDLERDATYRFFRLTDQARELFDRNDIFEREAYRNLFEQTEKTPEIRDAESTPRPAFE